MQIYVNALWYTLARLISRSRDLDRIGAPTCTYEESEANGHWSATRDELIDFLETERLDEVDVALLSMSRCYGPYPGLAAKVMGAIEGLLWPDGNPTGAWIEWDDLADRLTELYDESRKAWGTEIPPLGTIVPFRGLELTE